ncbi:hypothetical protein BJ546DRAFT_958475 [Cryomyces antarcticus]
MNPHYNRIEDILSIPGLPHDEMIAAARLAEPSIVNTHASWANAVEPAATPLYETPYHATATAATAAAPPLIAISTDSSLSGLKGGNPDQVDTAGHDGGLEAPNHRLNQSQYRLLQGNPSAGMVLSTRLKWATFVRKANGERWWYKLPGTSLPTIFTEAEGCSPCKGRLLRYASIRAQPPCAPYARSVLSAVYSSGMYSTLSLCLCAPYARSVLSAVHSSACAIGAKGRDGICSAS